MTVSLATDTTVGIDVKLTTGRVTASPSSLKVDVASFKYDIGGLRGVYIGAVGQTVTDDDTSYVYVSDVAALVINTTGFPAETHIPLARVVAVNGEVVAIHEERVVLASSSSAEGTCRVGYPVDGGIRGGGTLASSNNDMPAVRFAHDADGWNRWVGRPPQNYLSGDLVMRLLVTMPSSPANETSTKWQLEYAFTSIDDDLGSYGTPVENTIDFTGAAIADDLWALDFTIPSGDFDKTADLMFFKVSRLAEDAEDDCGIYVYVHAQELRYTGLLLAGQAGQ